MPRIVDRTYPGTIRYISIAHFIDILLSRTGAVSKLVCTGDNPLADHKVQTIQTIQVSYSDPTECLSCENVTLAK